MENEDEFDNTQTTPVSGKRYEWQMFVGHQWLPIDNDHVIETHYCHPGAKGITINSNQGKFFIDFDNFQTTNPFVKIQRLNCLTQAQTEEVGWYFKDDQLWREYGSQGSTMLSSSISSRDVEHQYTLNPQGTFRFTVGSTGYRLEFSTMTQINCITGVRRNVRRRPKIIPSTGSLESTSVLLTASPTQLTNGAYKWEFMGEEGVWTEYQAYICSFDSAAIERQYQLNPQGQIHFNINRFSYTLDFSRMCQVNNNIGTTRAVRRSQQTSSDLLDSEDSGVQANCQSKVHLTTPIRKRGTLLASTLPSARGVITTHSTSADPKLTNGRYYQWQLNDGTGWRDVDNDHTIEAQYCLPHNKSVTIYNAPQGSVSIDFKNMRVYGKSLRVRRLDDGNTEWIWYCSLNHKWRKYGDKDSKIICRVKNSDIEMKFQTNPSGSFTFSFLGETFEIRFTEMQQVNTRKKRKVSRRPVYQQQARTGVSQATSAFRNIFLGTKPQWQFEGNSGSWYVFKHRTGTSTECSVTSNDIERTYQRNRSGSMDFQVNGRSYKLDFGAMIQTNLTTKKIRRVRRV